MAVTATATMPAPLNVLVADPLPIYGEAIASMLRQRGYAAWAVTTARAALRHLQVGGVDLLLWSVELACTVPVPRVIAAARQKVRWLPVILLGDAASEEIRTQALRAGATWYLPRSAEARRIAGMVDQIADGQVAVVETDGVDVVVRAGPSHVTGRPHGGPLTERRLEIVQLIAEGLNNQEIGRTLGISDQTVKNHITDILRIIKSTSRAQAVAYCLHRGWIRFRDEEDMDATARAVATVKDAD